jgi:hypothetical protein
LADRKGQVKPAFRPIPVGTHVTANPDDTPRDGHGRSPVFVSTLILKKGHTKMKNLLISIAALAAVSTAALASDSVDLRDSDTYFGKFSTMYMASEDASTQASVEAFAVVGNGQEMTAFERMSMISEENEHGRK